MQTNYTTTRLSIELLSADDAAFIFTLVNTPGWLMFIGDRKVACHEDAVAYINKILNNPNVTYWVVRIKDGVTPIGIITFIKRDYLDHSDIGFAFLPDHAGQGYAYEAANAVLNDIATTDSTVLATTVPENVKSIQLLTKLGFRWNKEILQEGDTLLVYSNK